MIATLDVNAEFQTRFRAALADLKARAIHALLDLAWNPEAAEFGAFLDTLPDDVLNKYDDYQLMVLADGGDPDVIGCSHASAAGAAAGDAVGHAAGDEQPDEALSHERGPQPRTRRGRRAGRKHHRRSE
jgi:hypothetical protein